jgi:hypothetical protein
MRVFGCRPFSFVLLSLFAFAMAARAQDAAPLAPPVPPWVAWMVSQAGGPAVLVWLLWRAIGLGDRAFGIVDRSVTLAEDVWRAHKAGTLRPVLVDIRAEKPDNTTTTPSS